MKSFLKLAMVLIFICPSKYYSQRSAKGLSLKAGDLKTVEINGKTGWTMKTTLTNHSPDTLFYFITRGCEPANFMLYTEDLAVYFDKCDTIQAAIALPPSKERIVNLQITPVKAGFVEQMTSPLEFKVFLHIYEAKNINELPTAVASKKERRILVESNKVTIRKPDSKSKQSS